MRAPLRIQAFGTEKSIAHGGCRARGIHIRILEQPLLKSLQEDAIYRLVEARFLHLTAANEPDDHFGIRNSAELIDAGVQGFRKALFDAEPLDAPRHPDASDIQCAG